MKRLLTGALVWAVAAWTPARAASQLFESIFIDAEGGILFPAGNLEPVFDPAPVFGMRATSSYYGPLQAHICVQGARLDGGTSIVPAWYGAGGVGLEYRTRYIWLPAPGIGVSLDYGRVKSSDLPLGRHLFMEDGESEFGFYPSLRWRIPLGRAFFLVADLRDDVVLSEPKYSTLYSSHIGAGWRWK